MNYFVLSDLLLRGNLSQLVTPYLYNVTDRDEKRSWNFIYCNIYVNIDSISIIVST